MDRNRGGVFILWERLSGAFQEANVNEPWIGRGGPAP